MNANAVEEQLDDQISDEEKQRRAEMKRVQREEQFLDELYEVACREIVAGTLNDRFLAKTACWRSNSRRTTAQLCQRSDALVPARDETSLQRANCPKSPAARVDDRRIQN